MSISGIKTAMQTAIENALTGVKCYVGAPSVIGQLPCVYIIPRRGDYLINMPMGKIQVDFDIVLLLQRGDSLENVQDKLDTYILPSGTGSMKAAIEATALNTNADFLRVTGFSDYGGLTFSDTQYIGCKWQVSVMI